MLGFEVFDCDATSEAELFGGKLALITKAPDFTADEAVSRDKGLADIERGFRVLRPTLRLRRCIYRLPDCNRAHAMIRFLALVLYRVMRMWLKAKGHSASPRTACLLERIQQHVARIGPTTKATLTRQHLEQLELFEALSLKTAA